MSLPVTRKLLLDNVNLFYDAVDTSILKVCKLTQKEATEFLRKDPPRSSTFRLVHFSPLNSSLAWIDEILELF